jgi:hypothetical protein
MTAKRSKPATDAAALFEVGHKPGPSENAMRASLAEWRRAGRVIDPSMSSELRTAARAVDLARAEGTWALANAIRVVVQARVAYGLATAGPADDPFTAFIATLTESNVEEPVE